MNFDDYQAGARKTAIYPQDYLITYPALGLVGEAGEIANKVKKILRDDQGVCSDQKRAQLIEEMGDVLWYLAALASDLDVSLDMVATCNLQKLSDRATRNALRGEGDQR